MGHPTPDQRLWNCRKSAKMGKNPKFGPTVNGWFTNEDGLKSKNTRKQTHIKIQFYNRKKVTSFDFWTFWPSAPISLSPNIDGDYNHEGERINDPRPDPCFVCTVCTHCCKEKMDTLYSTPCYIFCSKISTKPALSNYTHIVCRPMYNKGHRLNRFQTCYEFYKNAKPHP